MPELTPELTPAERAQTVLLWDPTDAFTALCWLKDQHPEVFDAAASAVGRVRDVHIVRRERTLALLVAEEGQ